jgi:hypothetical protein
VELKITKPFLEQQTVPVVPEERFCDVQEETVTSKRKLFIFSERRWKQAQFIVNQFWRSWMNEYLMPSLIERKKW